jgi:cytosine permease
MFLENAKEELFKDYEREPVPAELRKNWLEMGLVWVGIGMCLAALMLGGVVGFGLDLTSAAAAIVLGSLVLTVINSLCSIVGADTGLSTAMIGRFAFGDVGVYITAAVLALGAYGWFAVQLGLFGETAATGIDLIVGASVSTQLLIIIGGILMLATAIYGYRGIALLSKIAVPIMTLILLASLIQVLNEHSWSELVVEPPPGDPMPFGVAASIIAGSFMVGAVIGPDITRYAKDRKHAVGAAILGFLIGFSLMVYLGSILAHAVGEWDAVKIMIGLGWGLIAIVVLILAQWTTNDNNLYSAALSLSVIFRTWPKWKLTLVAGILGIIIALSGIYGKFVQWLMILSATIPPIGGIYVTDYFLFHRDMYKYENLDKVPKFRPLMFLAWIGGSLIAFCTTPPPTGFGLFKLTTVPAVDAFIVAVILQAALTWTYRRVRGEWPEVVPL